MRATCARPSTPARTSTRRATRARRRGGRRHPGRATSSARRCGSTPARCATATRRGCSRAADVEAWEAEHGRVPGRRGGAAVHRLGRVPRRRRALPRRPARLPRLRRRRGGAARRARRGRPRDRHAGRSTPGAATDFPVHHIALPAGLWHLEGLIGLDAVPRHRRDAGRRRAAAAGRVGHARRACSRCCPSARRLTLERQRDPRCPPSADHRVDRGCMRFDALRRPRRRDEPCRRCRLEVCAAGRSAWPRRRTPHPRRAAARRAGAAVAAASRSSGDVAADAGDRGGDGAAARAGRPGRWRSTDRRGATGGVAPGHRHAAPVHTQQHLVAVHDPRRRWLDAPSATPGAESRPAPGWPASRPKPVGAAVVDRQLAGPTATTTRMSSELRDVGTPPRRPGGRSTANSLTCPAAGWTAGHAPRRAAQALPELTIAKPAAARRGAAADAHRRDPTRSARHVGVATIDAVRRRTVSTTTCTVSVPVSMN